MKSMTYAIKAQKALSEQLIDSEIIKLEANMTKKGCAYGLKFDCVNLYSAESALKRKGISYSEMIHR